MKIKKYKNRYLILIFICLMLFYVLDIFFNVKNLDIDNIKINYNNNLEKEYSELKKFNDLKINNENELIISKVMYRNIYNLNDEITIYKGFKNGINKGDAVVTNDGLVGIISKTYAYKSIVTLINNSKSNISVKINNSFGILKSINGKMVVENINNFENINIEDKIYTTGFGLVEENIYVGSIKNVFLNSTGIEKVIEVDLGVDLDKINYLFILRSNND